MEITYVYKNKWHLPANPIFVYILVLRAMHHNQTILVTNETYWILQNVEMLKYRLDTTRYKRVRCRSKRVYPIVSGIVLTHLPTGQNDRHFTNNFLRCISWIKGCDFFIKIKFKDTIDIFPEGYELWHPHNWPVTTTNHLPPHLANYLGHQRVSVLV